MTGDVVTVAEPSGDAVRARRTLLRGAVVLTSSRWLFPLVVVLGLLVLTVLGISGTSSAVLYEYLYGRSDPHVVVGLARGVRSDEWLVNTPMILAQAATGYRLHNPALGGRDMSVVFDVPYRDWSLLFRPQSWAFGWLPLDMAFAWRWWVLSAVLLLAVYALAVQLLPGARVFAALLGVSLLLAPFTQWWYVGSTLGCLGWGVGAAASFVWLLRADSRRQALVRSVVLWWTASCFALVLYPAFQIPCALVIVAVCVGHLVTRLQEEARRPLLLRTGAAVLAVAAAGAVTLAFFLTRREAFDAVAGTVYPGHREVPSGGFSLVRLMYGVVSPALQRAAAGAPSASPAVGGNQSEASAYLLVGLLLLGVCGWLLVRGRRNGLPVNGMLVTLPLLLVVFLAHLFWSGSGVLTHLLGLGLVPQNRLHIGLGLLSTMLVLATVAELRRQQVRAPVVLALASTLAALLLAGVAAWRVHHISSVLSGSWVVLAVSVLAFAAAVLLLSRAHVLAGVAVLAGLGAFASLAVNPVYRGVVDARKTAVGQAIVTTDTADPGGWVSLAGLYGNAVMVESGVRTYSAVSSYPLDEVWRDLDPTGRYRDVWNRYAHVVFQHALPGAPLQSPQADVVLANFDGCATFAQRRVRHVLAENLVIDPCFTLNREVQMGGRTFRIYDVVPPV